MTPDQQRRLFQRLKGMSNERFWKQMNVFLTKSYAAAERHYGEAMDIVLTPKQKAAVIAKATEIRVDWDKLDTIDIENTAGEELA